VRGNFAKGLRFRLTLTYVAFFSVAMIAVGLSFHQVLAKIFDDQLKEIVDEEWAAVKGYLRVDRREPIWTYDHDDPEEDFIVKRLQRVFLLADVNGKVLQVSDLYHDLGVNPPGEIKEILKSNKAQWQEKKSSDDEPFLIRAGLLIDDNKQPYFVAIGRSMAADNAALKRFSWDYFRLLPVMVLSSALLGWLMAGRALSPVNELARTAERISGANLKLRIPPRGSGDELDHLIHTFNHMIERLERSFEQTRQFSTDVSHELRTPLTAIRGQIEVALFTATSTEQYREAMINALEDVERLSQTIRALLLLSQAESGQLALQKAPLNLCAVIDDIVDQFQIPAEESRIEVSCELPDHCAVDADRIQIERLVSNLLSNAVKYTPPGGKVCVRVWGEANEVVIEVADTGVGIPPDHLPHIFDRFYRVPSQDREKGLGLGLSFVAWIVKAHGGRIDVFSELGKGTRFLIHLPAARAVAEEPSNAPPVAH
jgi:heavy metal sensor kinase